MYCNIEQICTATSKIVVLQYRKNICCNDPKNLIATFEIIYCNIKKLIATREKQKKNVHRREEGIGPSSLEP
jgi:hypothetical protein